VHGGRDLPDHGKCLLSSLGQAERFPAGNRCADASSPSRVLLQRPLSHLNSHLCFRLSLADAQQLACALAELKDISPGNRIKLKAASAAKYRVAAEIITTLPKEMYDDLGDEFTQNVRFVAGILEGHLLFQAAKNEAEKEQYGRAVALITSCHNMLLLCAKSEDLTIRDFATKLLPETDHLCTQYTKTNVRDLAFPSALSAHSYTCLRLELCDLPARSRK
jgi:hypothetical protein